METIFTEFISRDLEPDKLYVSERFGVAIHLCACGCGGKTVTPFSRPDDWKLTKNPDGTVSLSPSILNKWCGAHYWINNSQVTNFVKESPVTQ